MAVTCVATTVGTPFVSVIRYQPSVTSRVTVDASSAAVFVSVGVSPETTKASANARSCASVNVATYAAGLSLYGSGISLTPPALFAAASTAVFAASTVLTCTLLMVGAVPCGSANSANLYALNSEPAAAFVTVISAAVVGSACALAAPRAMPASSVAAAATLAKSFLAFMMRNLSSL